MSGGNQIAGWLGLGLLLAAPAGAAPKKGVSLDDLVPSKPATKPGPAAKKPTPRPTPRAAVKKPAPTVVKKPAVGSPVARTPNSTLTVGAGAPFRTIGAALRKAPAGARILVQAGTYRESLTLTKAVEIASARPDDVVIVEGSAQPGVLMKAGSATLRHLTLRLAPGASPSAYTVEVTQGELTLEDCTVSSGVQACVGIHGQAAKSTLRKCRLQGDAHGLLVDQKAEATLDECILSNNGGTGAFVSGGATANFHACRLAGNAAQGLVFKEGAQALVDDCDVTGSRTQGVLIESGAEPVLRNTRIFRNALAGVMVGAAGKGLLQDADLYENGAAGLFVRLKGAITARNSKFRLNQSEGIECADGGSARIEDGSILDNGAVGIAVRRGSELVLTQAKVVGKTLDAILVNGKSRATFDTCEISKAPGGAGAALHEGSQVTFHSCKFSGGKWGIVSTSGSDLLLDDCDITGMENNGVNASETTGQIRASRIFRNQGGGIGLTKCTQLSITQCEMYANQDTNFMVMEGSAPKVTRCSFRDSTRAGIWIAEGSRGTFDDCEIRGNSMSGIAIDKNGNPEVRNCRFLNGKGTGGYGVWAGAQAKGLFEDCVIQGNGADGALIVKGGNPLFRRCRVLENAGAGIVSAEGGLGTVEDSDIFRNRFGSAVSRSAGKLQVRATRTD